MKIELNKTLAQALILAVVATLTACGGGGGGGGGSDSGSNGSANNGTTVTAPAITTQPTAITITSAAGGTLTVVTAGTSPTYQWYKDSTAISGATSASLTVTAGGNYYVIVTNSAGSVTSNTIAVTDVTTYSQQLAQTPFTFTGTSDSGVMEAATYSYLNTVRIAANAGAVNADATLNTASLAHSNYLLNNTSEFGHTEISGHTGYTGVNPSDRVTAASYTGNMFSEGAIGYANLAAPYTDSCPKILLNTMYHMSSMLGPVPRPGHRLQDRWQRQRLLRHGLRL